MTIRQQISCSVFLALSSAVSAAAQKPGPAPEVGTIVERMAQARAKNRASFHPYVVTRNYALYGKTRITAKSEVTVQVTFMPPDSKKYSIVQRTGSGLGERLVRKMLDGETTIVKENGATDFSLDNYEFLFAGEERINGRRCYMLELFPRRKDKTLLRGTLWVDSETYLVHRMEGAPAKSPSWWLRNARITFSYGDVEGMWLQTASEFTTNVRFFGEHTMTAHDVKYDVMRNPNTANHPEAEPLHWMSGTSPSPIRGAGGLSNATAAGHALPARRGRSFPHTSYFQENPHDTAPHSNHSRNDGTALGPIAVRD